MTQGYIEKKDDGSIHIGKKFTDLCADLDKEGKLPFTMNAVDSIIRQTKTNLTAEEYQVFKLISETTMDLNDEMMIHPPLFKQRLALDSSQVEAIKNKLIAKGYCHVHGNSKMHLSKQGKDVAQYIKGSFPTLRPYLLFTTKELKKYNDMIDKFIEVPSEKMIAPKDIDWIKNIQKTITKRRRTEEIFTFGKDEMNQRSELLASIREKQKQLTSMFRILSSSAAKDKSLIQAMIDPAEIPLDKVDENYVIDQAKKVKQQNKSHMGIKLALILSQPFQTNKMIHQPGRKTTKLLTPPPFQQAVGDLEGIPFKRKNHPPEIQLEP